MRTGWTEVEAGEYTPAHARRFEGHGAILNWWGECDGWTAQTVGLIWHVFQDGRQHKLDAVDDAQEVLERCMVTGQPPSGGWG